ncbi:MAG: sensor histidine kinase [Lentimicrobium sp.]
MANEIPFYYFLITILLALMILGGVLIYYLRASREKNRMIKLLSDQNKSILNTQEELRKAKEKAEESDKLKSAFLANMSHEIRPPLNAIMGFSSLLLDSGPEEEDRRQFVSIIHNNSNKLLDLMGEIFDIAQIESGLIVMQREPCQINEMLMSLITFFNLEKGLSDKEHINIRMQKANKDHSFTILTDERKLRQTLFNLIENALKYTNDGFIEVGYRFRENSMVEFYVRDSGIGFPQEKLDVLFQRFRQVEEGHNRNYGGIGLGLTLSKKFVELMGGEMWAESKPGTGSVFYFTLPCQVADK